MKNQSTTHKKLQRGQSLVEVALFFPIFVILLAGLVEVSQLLVTQNKVSSAARAATRFLSNGGEDAGIQTVLLNTVTQTLATEDTVWDVWSIRATINDAGNGFDDWQFTQVYGVSNTVRSATVNESEIQSQVLDELRRDENNSPSDAIAVDLKIVGTYAIHDVDSILGLDAMKQLAGFSSLNALSIMRITADSQVVTNGCAAFPIAVHEGSRSVTAPGTGSNPYPNAGEFDYPNNPPIYQSFVNHDDNVPLLDAQEGDVFKVRNGFGDGNFGWLVWNTGISANANTLADSLSWPGNSIDYNNYNDGGSAIAGSGYGYVVRGYIEPGDPTDQSLHEGDWVAASTGTINANGVRTVIEGHVDLDRAIRMVVWNNSTGSGVNGRYQISGFAVFRIVGYNLSQDWLLAEFIRWDDSCGQLN